MQFFCLLMIAQAFHSSIAGAYPEKRPGDCKFQLYYMCVLGGKPDVVSKESDLLFMRNKFKARFYSAVSNSL